MTEQELYATYAKWSGELHFYCVKFLGTHIDCQYFPETYRFGLYSGHAQEKGLQVWNFQTVPGFTRPAGEAAEVIQLPRPEDNPTQEDLDAAFKNLCLAAARVLEIDLGKAKLPTPEKSMLILKKSVKRPRLKDQ